jgi:hypothetical protein
MKTSKDAERAVSLCEERERLHRLAGRLHA